MCGILGSTANTGSDRFKIALDKLEYRGPDANGYYIDHKVQLGHTRLSIIDLNERSNQPMSSADGRYVIVYNGEIYNFQEIRAELDYEFITESDTEVVLAAFMVFGIELTLKKMRGMFAFAIYDSLKSEIIIARDHIGKKPLYFSTSGKNLIFSSTIDSLIALKKNKPGIRESSVYEYFIRSYISAPHTIYDSIQALEPGSYLTYSLSQRRILKEVNYWQPRIQQATSSISLKDYKYQLKEKLIASVKRRLVSDVPVGLFLSGGIDSSLIASICTNELKHPIKTYSVGFENSDLDESIVARKISSILKTDHTTLMLEESDFDQVKTIIKRFGQPFGDHSAVPTALMSFQARKHIKVALTGDGGDEGFGGYHTHLALKFAQQVSQNLLYGYSKPLFKPIEKWSSAIKWINMINSKKGGHYVSDLTGRKGFRNNREIFSNKEFNIDKTDEIELKMWQTSNKMSWLQKGILMDLKTILPNALLVKTDVSTMCYALEARSPFLDIDVLQFGLSLPDEYKVRGKSTKFILRDLLSQYLPKKIISLPKKGFSFDVKNFILKNQKILNSFILDQNWSGLEVLNKDEIENFLYNNSSPNHITYNQIWLLFAFFTWKEEYSNGY